MLYISVAASDLESWNKLFNNGERYSSSSEKLLQPFQDLQLLSKLILQKPGVLRAITLSIYVEK